MNFEHDKRFYVRNADLLIWKEFEEKYRDKKSHIIVTLIRLLMSGKLYYEDGRQVKL